MANLQDDEQLEKEADRSGMIHSRRPSSRKSEFLPGYGTTNFGISPFEEAPLKTNSVLIGSGFAATGILLWAFKDRISSGIGTLTNYALLKKESLD
jgi:hypothetical protein